MKMVQVTLDKERVLKFGTRAYVELEKVLDVNIDNINMERQETIYAMIYAGLVHQDRKLTIDKLYDIIDEMIDKKAEEENIPFMDAYGKVLEYLGTKLAEALGNEEVPSEQEAE